MTFWERFGDGTFWERFGDGAVFVTKELTKKYGDVIGNI